jgi:hypothetical protein
MICRRHIETNYVVSAAGNNLSWDVEFWSRNGNGKWSSYAFRIARSYSKFDNVS